jgi:dolichol-phosphate mannosyltransferase
MQTAGAPSQNSNDAQVILEVSGWQKQTIDLRNVEDMTTQGQDFCRVEARTGVPAYDVHEFRPRRNRIALVIPVINEGDRLITQLARIEDHADEVDVIIADGGSTDGSTELERLEQLGVSTLLIKRDSGRLSAELRAAFDYALNKGYSSVMTMDGNDKDGAEGISRIVAALDEGADFVQGSRFVRGGVAKNTPKARYLAIRAIHAPVMSLAARHKFTDTTNGFRGYSRRLLEDPNVDYFRDVFNTYEHVAYLPVRAARLGYDCCEVPVSRCYPPGKPPTKIGGMSGYVNLVSLLWGAARGRYNPPGT